MKVIVFDDNELVLEVITHFIRMKGHDVHGFPDPTACPLYATPDCTCPEERPCTDVLLTDNAMPVMTGLQFIGQQELKGCKGATKNKAVMAGSWTLEELDLAEQMGCRVFTKPVDLMVLNDWLEECRKRVDDNVA